MDDFIPQTLNESLNEWCARLVNILTPRVTENLWLMLEDARRMASDTKQLDKYLLTFQQLLQFVPKWSVSQVEDVKKNVIEKSGCGYLEDMVTCVHIIMAKSLVCARPGNRQKQLNMSIPKLDVFIHKVFIKSAGHSYRNVYLFRKEVSKLDLQRNMHDLEKLVQRAILDVIRENIPEEEIIRAFLDENYEYEDEVIIEPVPDQPVVVPTTTAQSVSTETSKPLSEAEIASLPFIQDVNKDAEVITRLETTDNSRLVLSKPDEKDTEPTVFDIGASLVPTTTHQLADLAVSDAFAKVQAESADAVSAIADEIKMETFELPSVSKPPETQNTDFLLDIQELS